MSQKSQTRFWLFMFAMTAVMFIGTLMLFLPKYNKCYKAACMFSDCIRLEYDLLEEEEQFTYTAYSALDEWCCEDQVNTDSLLEKYVWCY